MNQYLKLIAPAIGALMVALPFTIANFASKQATTYQPITVELAGEEKLADSAETVETNGKTEKRAPAKKVEAATAGWKFAVVAEPEKAKARRNTAPTESDTAEAEEVAALAEPDTAVAKQVATLAEPDKAEARKEAVPTELAADDLALALQTELKRVGCYEGTLDGLWSVQSRAALYAFVNSSKIEATDFDPSEAWIRHVKDNTEIVCNGASHDVPGPQQASWSGDQLRYVYRAQPVPSSRDDLRDVDRPEQASKSGDDLGKVHRSEQASKSGDDLRYAHRPQQDPKPGDDLRKVHRSQQSYRAGDELRYVGRPRQNDGSGAELSYSNKRPSEEVDWGYWGTAGEVDDGH